MQVTECPHAQKLDPRVKRTRKLIVEAFRGLLSEKSYAEISVGDVAQRATVNRATFYAHFSDKEHLICSMLQGDFEEKLFLAISPGTAFGRETFQQAGEAVFEFVAATVGHCPKQADELGPVIMSTLQETIERFVYHWLENDPHAMKRWPNAGRDSVATVIGWSLFGGALNWTRRGRTGARKDAVARIVSLIY